MNRTLALGVLLIELGCAPSSHGPDPSTLTLASGGKADGNGAFAPYHCPQGSRFATNGSDGMFCLYENLWLPENTAITPLCELSDGYIGFAYGSTSASYTCPWPAQQLGTMCRYPVTDAPRGAEPYCEYLLSAHTIGYSWDLCPPGSSRLPAGDSVTCTFTSLPIPDGASPYCDYVDRGYLGWSWTPTTAAPAACPTEFRLAYNDAGSAFCLLENLALPDGLQIEAHCDGLAAGRLAFSASQEASLPPGASGPTWPVDGGGPTGVVMDGGGPTGVVMDGSGPTGVVMDGSGPTGPVMDGSGPTGPTGPVMDGGTCATCGTVLASPWISTDSMCPETVAKWESLQDCACWGDCSSVCAADVRCTGNAGIVLDECSSCMTSTCGSVYDACEMDIAP